jgi:DNA-binding transcriptional regulator/RsmH inhibitor MraZ
VARGRQPEGLPVAVEDDGLMQREEVVEEEVAEEEVVKEQVVAAARQVLFRLLEAPDFWAERRMPSAKPGPVHAASRVWPEALAALAAGVYHVALDAQGRLRLPKAALALWGVPTERSEQWFVITDFPLGVTALWKPEFFARFEEETVNLLSASAEEEATCVIREMYRWQDTGELRSRTRLTLPARLRREQGLDGRPVELLVYRQGLMVVKAAAAGKRSRVGSD